jgi:hypothetical protein
MTARKTRFTLLWVFFISLLVQLVCLFIVRLKMWPEEFVALLVKMLALYSVQLGVVLGGLFSQQKIASRQSSKVLNWTALAFVGLWNLLLLSRTFLFATVQQDSVSDFSKYLDVVGSGSAFLIAGVVSFFFGKSMPPSAPAAEQSNREIK